MSWYNSIAKRIGKWIAPAYFSDSNPYAKLETDAKSLQIKVATTKDQYGATNKICINIRILYPRAKPGHNLDTAELFCAWLYVALQWLKEDISSPSIEIRDIRIDARGRTSTKDDIFADIRDKNCLIIIVLSKESIEKKNEDGSGAYKHEYLIEEIELINELIKSKDKNEHLFLPLYLCNPDNLFSDEMIRPLKGLGSPVGNPYNEVIHGYENKLIMETIKGIIGDYNAYH